MFFFILLLFFFKFFSFFLLASRSILVPLVTYVEEPLNYVARHCVFGVEPREITDNLFSIQNVPSKVNYVSVILLRDHKFKFKDDL